jgi:hypothetical protein
MTVITTVAGCTMGMRDTMTATVTTATVATATAAGTVAAADARSVARRRGQPLRARTAMGRIRIGELLKERGLIDDAQILAGRWRARRGAPGVRRPRGGVVRPDVAQRLRSGPAAVWRPRRHHCDQSRHDWPRRRPGVAGTLTAGEGLSGEGSAARAGPAESRSAALPAVNASAIRLAIMCVSLDVCREWISPSRMARTRPSRR